MPKRILVDAVHPEETRVVLLENGRVQEFDSETSIKQQVKGNIYLAKVTRVEPSLQAAFVEYGSDRHGFLPFSEIHPDYYQIPNADKKELIEALRRAKRAGAEFDDEEEAKEGGGGGRGRGRRRNKRQTAGAPAGDEDDAQVEGQFDDVPEDEGRSSNDLRKYLGKYKINEVIKRNQIILVQVEKEERGNKGASLTSYISLAGKYCVLMPNAHRQGGVSRRIADFEDRKRLKKVLREIGVSEEASIIIRTAGAGKSKSNIESDYNYLVNLWNTIRERTLSSTAPALIHDEADVLRRAIRDMFDDRTDEMLIEGDESYKLAKEFVSLLMPENKQRVKRYINKVPILSRYKVEEQISALYEAEAHMESGGYIVINPTEALISIDVNSGKATSSRNVEETALATNLEAAREVARQLRLRDLSGLIVVDFIDMMEFRNRKAVERELRSALHMDRAKVQVGRISTFGLLEMSRQRLKPSFYEINAVQCPQCEGIGVVKATGTLSAVVLRQLEYELSRTKTKGMVFDVYVHSAVSNYILNFKRAKLAAIESEYDARIYLLAADMEPEGVQIEARRPDESDIEELEAESSQKAEESNRKKGRRPDKKEGGGKGRRKVDAGGGHKFAADSQPSEDDGFLKGLWNKIID